MDTSIQTVSIERLISFLRHLIPSESKAVDEWSTINIILFYTGNVSVGIAGDDKITLL